MPRDKFISDNLINIRDYLREKCADIAQEQSAPEIQAEQQEIHLNLKTAVSSGNSGSESIEVITSAASANLSVGTST